MSSSNVHRREPCYVRSIKPLFRLSFIVRQPFDFTRLELKENHLLLISPLYILETFTFQSRELSVFDAAIELKWRKWTLYLYRAFPKKSQLFTRGESLELPLKYFDLQYPLSLIHD